MAKMKNTVVASTPIDAVRHKDTRKNIPTEELRDFVKEEENKPKTILYPRDPSLDPQLVWKGKDEQDRKPLEVPSVPIYIQEKIHPQAIIEDFRKTGDKTAANDSANFGFLFSDFNGLPKDFADKVDFYHHDGHWSNRMILGDSLLVMTSLAEKEGLKGRVQTIYFDPPYGIKFGSNWQVSTRKRDVKDGKAEDATRQPEQVRAFRDTWKLGIHSYLSYLRDRLVVARELLTDSGSIFVQIGDENVHHVREVMDEVFGPANFVAQIHFVTTTGRQEAQLDRIGNYLLWFAKDIERVKSRKLYTDKAQGDEAYSAGDLQSQGVRSTGSYRVTFGGMAYQPLPGNHWKVTEDGMRRLVLADRVLAMKTVLRFKRLPADFPVVPYNDVWTDTAGGAGPDKMYVVQTSTKIAERCILMTTDPGDLVLDPTCGSGTTAYVAEQWGRRWITMDTSRVALALARTRLMCGRFAYYVLADSAEGRKREVELGYVPASAAVSVVPADSDIRRGFVCERAPHVTLGSIANNPDIKEGMTRAQIDAAIERHTETEILYNKPYEDSKRLRVTGPFTVESLSPHRTISVEAKKQAAEKPAAEGFTIKMLAGGSFTNMILENLKKAGVQNASKAERLKFDSLEPYPGEWIAGEGKYTEKDGKARRAAICIGPEYGTVGPELIKQSAKEAVRGVGFDVMIVCGFAFDPHVTEEAKRYGNLTVLICRMNPDLSMGDDLLKKTGAGNLFMVFGEPDIEVNKGKDGKVVVEIKGLDVYDPTTGEIRSNTTDEIACWFIDTNYDGESFFVRHAYFTGADEPYEKLKKALRAEIDEGAWSQLYSNTSRGFEKPQTGKIAVKVINHYGDEVMKVYEVK